VAKDTCSVKYDPAIDVELGNWMTVHTALPWSDRSKIVHCPGEHPMSSPREVRLFARPDQISNGRTNFAKAKDGESSRDHSREVNIIVSLYKLLPRVGQNQVLDARLGFVKDAFFNTRPNHDCLRF